MVDGSVHDYDVTDAKHKHRAYQKCIDKCIILSTVNRYPYAEDRDNILQKNDDSHFGDENNRFNYRDCSKTAVKEQ